jgi:hypothetical protein
MSAHARDGDPPGVRAAWSPGAMTGQRGSAGRVPRRCDPVSGVVLVVAVACWARGVR